MADGPTGILSRDSTPDVLDWAADFDFDDVSLSDVVVPTIPGVAAHVLGGAFRGLAPVATLGTEAGTYTGVGERTAGEGGDAADTIYTYGSDGHLDPSLKPSGTTRTEKKPGVVLVDPGPSGGIRGTYTPGTPYRYPYLIPSRYDFSGPAGMPYTRAYWEDAGLPMGLLSYEYPGTYGSGTGGILGSGGSVYRPPVDTGGVFGTRTGTGSTETGTSPTDSELRTIYTPETLPPETDVDRELGGGTGPMPGDHPGLPGFGEVPGHLYGYDGYIFPDWSDPFDDGVRAYDDMAAEEGGMYTDIFGDKTSGFTMGDLDRAVEESIDTHSTLGSEAEIARDKAFTPSVSLSVPSGSHPDTLPTHDPGAAAAAAAAEAAAIREASLAAAAAAAERARAAEAARKSAAATKVTLTKSRDDPGGGAAGRLSTAAPDMSGYSKAVTAWEGGRHGGPVTRDASGAVVSSSSDFSSVDFLSGGDWGAHDYGGDYGIGDWL